MEINYKNVVKFYLIIFFILMLIYSSVNVPTPIGEWDDYAIPIASLIYEHDFSISDNDIKTCIALFPEWRNHIENYNLSPYMTRDGKEMAWYFPTYSAACIPFVIFLNSLELPTIYAFPYTNLFFLLIALLVVWYYLNESVTKKSLLIISLSINPIIFYISWPSAEVFIYSILVISCVFWYNHYYKRAGFFVSIAGTLNPTIMSIGIIMIIEYIIILIKSEKRTTTWKNFIKKTWIDVSMYGCCYIVGIIPLAYNFYHTGHINLSASLSKFTQTETTLDRFISYLFDLNYGIFPYFFIFLVLANILVIPAILYKHWQYLKWMTAFFLNIMLYSLMTHINCGMSGIARYNAWGIVLLLFAVCLLFDKIIQKNIIVNIIKVTIPIGLCVTSIIIFKYGPYIASNTYYTNMTPIADWVLDKAPGLYNPLHSTFVSRTEHIDGGYNYETPVVYYTNGYVRKILASSKDANELRKDYTSISGNNDWLENQVDKLSDTETYISIPEKYHIVKCNFYKTGSTIFFHSNDINYSSYVISGLSKAEEWGSWTSGNKLIINLRTESNSKNLRSIINYFTFGNQQQVRIFVNGNLVYDEIVTGEPIKFSFHNPGINEAIQIRLELPDANSPASLGISDDTRILALGIKSMTIIDD